MSNINYKTYRCLAPYRKKKIQMSISSLNTWLDCMVLSIKASKHLNLDLDPEDLKFQGLRIYVQCPENHHQNLYNFTRNTLLTNLYYKVFAGEKWCDMNTTLSHAFKVRKLDMILQPPPATFTSPSFPEYRLLYKISHYRSTMG